MGVQWSEAWQSDVLCVVFDKLCLVWSFFLVLVVKALPHVTISSTMVFKVAKIASARASSTISLTKSLRVAGP